MSGPFEWRIQDIERTANRQKVGFMSLIRSVAMWVVWNIPCGNFAPRLMGFALNSKPVKSNTRRI